MDDAGSVFALEGTKGFKQLDDVGFVGRVAARRSPVGIIERACLGVHHDKGGVGMVD